MKRIEIYSSIILLTLLAACSPVVYKGSHSHQYPTQQSSTVYQPQTSYHAPVHSDHQARISAIYRGEGRRVGDLIEVTLYLGKFYSNGNRYSNQPIILRIADGDMVKFVANNKKAHKTNLYAHYVNRNLHIDTDRNCNRLHGSASYNFDQSWRKGRRYTKINAGNNYDFKDSQLRIHAVPIPGHKKQKAAVTSRVPKVVKKVIVHKVPQKRQYRDNEPPVIVRQSGKSHVQQIKHKQPKGKEIKQKVIVHKSQQNQRHNDNDQVIVVKQSSKNHIQQVRNENQKPNNPKHVERSVVIKRKPTNNNDRRLSRKAARVERDVPEASQRYKNRQTPNEQANKGRIVSAQAKTTNNVKSTKSKAVTGKQQVKVTFSGGKGQVNGKGALLHSKSITLKEGQRRSVHIATKNGGQLTLPITFANGRISIDESKQFNSVPGWTKGKSYRVSTKGLAQLQNVKMTVVAL